MWFSNKTHCSTTQTITCTRFPADSSSPHLVSLPTTTADVSTGPLHSLGHIPDMRSFWKTTRGWECQEGLSITLRNQGVCSGTYMTFFSYDAENLQQNTCVPDQFGAPHSMWGDVFVVKMAEGATDGWAVYEDVAPELLRLACVTRSKVAMAPGRGVLATKVA